MIELILNSETTSHNQKLDEILPGAKEVFIAVAFLKRSGLNKLQPYLNQQTRFHVLAGYNFGITEPDALSILHDKMKRSANITAYLVNLNLRQVFHTKMYLIEDEQACHIIVGSANLTKGGWLDNGEASIYHKCQPSDAIWLQCRAYFDECTKPLKADLLSVRIIAIYRKFHKKQRPVITQAEEFPELGTNLIYDLSGLKRHYRSLDKSEFQNGIKLKRQHYNEARVLLNQIADQSHIRTKFIELVEDLVGRADDPGLWYSNGMFRHKAKIFDQQPLFRELIKTIRDNLQLSPEDIYNAAKALTAEIKGVGPNFIGEIMMTYSPDKLANIKRNPITVLKDEGGADIKGHSSGYNGKNYEEYNAILHEIALELDLADMLEVDYFFNIIYQKIKKQIAA